MPDLSGDLATFDVRQILTLLADAGKTGELRVTVDGHVGRTFFDQGSVVYATLRSGTDAVHEVDSLMQIYGAAAGNVRTDDRPLLSPADALLEQITEVFFTLTQMQSGSFDFDEEAVVAPFNADGDHTFSVQEILSRVADRIEQWRKIGEVIPSIHDPYRLAPELPAGTFEVTLDARTFRYLAGLRQGRSVVEAAQLLGTSEFSAAKKMADLVKQGLLELADTSPPTVAVPPEEELVVSDEALSDEPVEYEEPDGAGEPETPPGANLPRVQPTIEPVSFATGDLSRDEINEKIRNFSRGIYSSD